MTVVWSAPVRYAECDQQGIVFNAHYLTWADEACTAWLRGDYEDMLRRGLDMRVKSSTLVWSGPATWGDVVDVHASLGSLGRTSWSVVLEVRVRERVCCVVTTTYVMVDEAGVPTPVPDDLRARWSA